MTFLDFCRLHGVIIDTLPPQGVWRRYKTEDKPQHKNGAVKYEGDFGLVQNHATMDKPEPWHPDAGVDSTPKRDEAAIAARRRKDIEWRERSIRSAQAYWDQCRPLNRLHPYLERKGLSALGCAGLREHDGVLVVPVIGDTLISVQSIFPDGAKRFWAGAPVKGGAFILTRARTGLTVLCEGLATGLAIYQSVRHCTVVVAFDCGNLSTVADRLRPQGSVVIAADNDHATQVKTGVNPGLEKARNVAEMYGYGVAAPQGIEGSDWADALKEWGQGAAGKVERAVHAQARLVMT
jgi:putative DNA primase/helicase